MIREVADKVGTRPVDEIRVTPGTEMAVYERGSASERRRDEARRVLILGVGLLNDFQQGAFLAVLAHEYGHFAFRRISHGATRLQEVLADRMAARVYGPTAFEEGLRHVIRRSEFEAAVNLELRMAAQNRRHVDNLYALPPLPRLSSIEVERTISDALARPTTDDDTHPGPADRFRFVQRVSYDGPPSDPTRGRLCRDLVAAPPGAVRFRARRT